jgi:hypothetical protein
MSCHLLKQYGRICFWILFCLIIIVAISIGILAYRCRTCGTFELKTIKIDEKGMIYWEMYPGRFLSYKIHYKKETVKKGFCFSK